MALIPGEKVILRGREFELPPLTLDALERYWPRIQALATDDLPVRMDTMREVIHASLAENYPDLRVDDLRKYLDMANVGPTFRLVMGRKGEGEGSGEA